MSPAAKKKSDSVDPNSEIGFAAAMEELNRIVTELEADDVDVDVMAERVERAALLVSICRDRLDATRYHVEEIIVGLDGEGARGDDSEGADADDSDSDIDD